MKLEFPIHITLNTELAKPQTFFVEERIDDLYFQSWFLLTTFYNGRLIGYRYYFSERFNISDNILYTLLLQVCMEFVEYIKNELLNTTSYDNILDELRIYGFG